MHANLCFGASSVIFFYVVPSSEETSFWPPSMVYISVIITHITHYKSCWTFRVFSYSCTGYDNKMVKSPRWPSIVQLHAANQFKNLGQLWQPIFAKVSLFQVAKAPTNLYDYTLPSKPRSNFWPKFDIGQTISQTYFTLICLRNFREKN